MGKLNVIILSLERIDFLKKRGATILNIEELIKSEIKNIVRLFVDKDYITLNDIYMYRERDIEDFIRSLNEYWQYWDHEGIVTMPPDEEFEKVDIFEIAKPNSKSRKFSITFDFWIDGERSDLTLDCDGEYNGGENLKLYLYDLHVL